jgi:hypothetical protein
MKSMKKALLLIPILVFVGILVGCKKDTEPAVQLQGVWVEQTDRADTLIFEVIDAKPFLSLQRGTEARDGHQLPKYGSGMYDYQVKKDSISLLSLYSSCNNCQQTYYLTIMGSELRIGDFYQKNSASSLPLTFEKIK